MTVKSSLSALNCPCRASRFSKVFSYNSPPKGEVRFHFSSSQPYRREVRRCRLCGHFISVHDLDDKGLYNGDYVNSNYGQKGIREAFDRILSLPPSESDNAGRVNRVLKFAAEHFQGLRESRTRSILDVGSGLCVFLQRMKEAGWDCTALDPDIRSVRHARKTVGIKAIHGDFSKLRNPSRFDVVTFNKVLEHVRDPVRMLARSATYILTAGFVYLEVPDGEAAIREGPEREEFFIDHHHAFSAASVALLSERAGFSIRTIERLREPSGKYTLRAFLVRSPGG